MEQKQLTLIAAGGAIAVVIIILSMALGGGGGQRGVPAGEERASWQGLETCVTVHVAGNSSEKLDIVFVGDKYPSYEAFASDVNAHYQTLLSIYPFSEYQDRINVHLVDSLEDFNCYITSSKLIYCDDNAIAKAAAECPNDEIIVLLYNDGIAGSANPYAYATHNYPEITVHEFGHAFGPKAINLADEYSYGQDYYPGSIFENPPNCDVAGCPKWKDVPGMSCVSLDKFGDYGCTFNEWYRPAPFNEATGESIMEGANVKYRTSPLPTIPVKFNTVSELHLISLLERYE